jgi:voltage-gated potassium channel
MSKKAIDRFINHLVDSCDSLRETLTLYVCTIAIATAGFTLFEGWSMFESFYTAVVTSSSTGYGDFSPKTIGGRATSVALIFSTIFFIIPMIVGHIISIFAKNRNEFTHEEQEELKRKIDTLLAALEKKESVDA